ncbi:hypothetical protein [Halobacteriovorax sp. HLS]|uniref:hypothetical protein n=1 Tax=Halobacteriovorax sp. HLS TaxID=2234000 RepID=UPI000FD92AC6|nr:hypothetical protein [Halobacteriovorax sp. HLS]
MNLKINFILLLLSFSTKCFASFAPFADFNIDPRKYSLILDYHNESGTEGEKVLKENYKFKFPLIEFYKNKELNGPPIGKLNEEGLYIEVKKVCYTKNILAENYNILLEDVVLPGYLGDGDVYTVGEYSNGIKFNAIRCPFLGYRQEADLELMTALVLEDYDEKTKLAKIRLGDGVAYFSAKKLSLHYLHRPPLQTMDHYGVDPIEFAKHIESKFAEYLKQRRDRFKPKVSGETFEQRYGLENYFSLSNLDWMDRYGAKEYKESLIKKYGKLQIIKHFDFENMFVYVRKFKNSIKGKKDIIKLSFVKEDMDSYRLFKNFTNNHIRYSDFKIGFLKDYDQFKRSRGLIIPTQEYEGYPMEDF